MIDLFDRLAARAGSDDERALLRKLRRRFRGRKQPPQQPADLCRDKEETKVLRRLVRRTMGGEQRKADSGKRTGDRGQPSDAYKRHMQRTAVRAAVQSRAGRDIGPLPDVADPDDRDACRVDLKRYLETYHASAFPLPWSDDQLRLIKKLQVVILTGALLALAMPRGSGKTTILRAAVEWAILYGHRSFVMLIGASDEKAEEALEQITIDLETNGRLLADFPEVCWPLACLEGIHNRAKGQLLDGEPTRIRFRKRLLQLPSVAGSAASGAVIKTGGLLSAVRGANHRLPDGRIVRPDLVLIDDPQTRDSAESPDQSAKRLRIITADVLGMAGPGAQIAALVTCTVVAPGDLADALTDREKYPEWRGERTKLLTSFPDDDAMPLWEEYWDVFCAAMKDDGADAIPAEANAFYRRHRAAMDRGASVSWVHRKRPDELSPVQHAMNLFFRDEAAFWSEMQNEPRPIHGDDEFLDAAQIARKVNEYVRGAVPLGVQFLTAFVDVHKRALVWAVVGWEPDFTGYVLDYGTWPEPTKPTWKMQRFRPTLMEAYKGQGQEASVYSGLEYVVGDLATRVWKREDGIELPLARCPVDAGWDSAIVRKFCRESPHRGIVLPSLGRTCGANEIPISQYRKRPGELLGHEWILKKGQGRHGGSQQHLIFDTWYWKTFLHRRLATPIGDPGALTLFGRARSEGKGQRSGKKPRQGGRRADHALFARHLDAEYAEMVVGKRQVHEWHLKPGHSENHWFDCVVGSAVAASLCGVSATGPEKQQRRRTKSFSQMAREKAERRRAA